MFLVEKGVAKRVHLKSLIGSFGLIDRYIDFLQALELSPFWLGADKNMLVFIYSWAWWGEQWEAIQVAEKKGFFWEEYYCCYIYKNTTIPPNENLIYLVASKNSYSPMYENQPHICINRPQVHKNWPHLYKQGTEKCIDEIDHKCLFRYNCHILHYIIYIYIILHYPILL